MKTRYDRSKDGKTVEEEGNQVVLWNIKEEISKVIERGAALRYIIKGFVYTDGQKEHWSLKEEITKIDKSVLDHNPVWLGELEEDWCPKPFRFCNAWLEDKQMMEGVVDVWRKCLGGRSWGGKLLLKTIAVKGYMRFRSKTRSLDGSQINLLENDLALVERKAEISGWSLGLRQDRLAILAKFWKQIKLDEKKWRQASRMIKVNTKRRSISVSVWEDLIPVSYSNILGWLGLDWEENDGVSSSRSEHGKEREVGKKATENPITNHSSSKRVSGDILKCREADGGWVNDGLVDLCLENVTKNNGELRNA
ncbi:hypothetical protein LWI28_015444 [Acer negundo]|uniref:Uncharacterized protein n=1 Tax=Acer negundo TaxID=4023 RepID=A0AAD5NLT1_ACENE|nr:hypothetical protein LWI28_015444 [Acer negundo]